jgi:D-amino-acid dehydrogenase
MAESRQRACVIGAGIVGLNAAFWLKRAGFDVTVIDRDPAGDRASHGNAGAIAVAECLPIPEPGIARKVPGYLFDPLGPLSIRIRHLPWLWPYLRNFLAAAKPDRYRAGAAAMAGLLKTAMDDHATLLAETKLAHLIARRGGLFVYRSEASRAAAAEGWAIRRELGLHAEPLDRAAIEALEPCLGREAGCGYYTEDWAHYRDPKELCDGLLDYLRRSGVEIIAADVVDFEMKEGRPTAAITSRESRRPFDQLVICAGAWSHKLSARFGDFFPLETERGYNTTIPNPGLDVSIMTSFAEDHFVMTPMAVGLRIGGAAEFAGLTAPPDYRRSKALLALAKRYLPGLKTAGGREWMGHRPSTPDSLPVIGPSARFPNVHYGFGHGHLGLTGSATTGRLLADLVSGRKPNVDLRPFRITRFNADDRAN